MLQNIITVCINSIEEVKQRFTIYTWKFWMFKQTNRCLSTAIYIDAIFSYYLMIFLKIPSRRKYFRLFKYIILVYVAFALGFWCCSKNVFVQSVKFRQYSTTTNKNNNNNYYYYYYYYYYYHHRCCYYYYYLLTYFN